MRTMNRLATTIGGILAISLAAVVLAFAFPGDINRTTNNAVTAGPDQKGLTTASATLFEVIDKLEAKENVVLLDARSQEDYEAGHIKGAISLPYAIFSERFAVVRADLPADAELIAYCGGNSCELSTKLAEALTEQGYSKVKVFIGGWSDWLAGGYPIESGKSK